MGHDIIAQNNTGESIVHLRFTMWDANATEIYQLMDVEDLNGGVSGIGKDSSFSQFELENVLKNYDEDKISYPGTREHEIHRREEIRTFLINCLEIAKREKNVLIYFG